MKKLLLFCTGLFPFLAGFSANAVLMSNMDVVPPYKLLGIVMLLLLGLFGYLMGDYTDSAKKSTLFANIIAFAVLLLLLYQELILGRYWPNIWGIATQMYYLPLLNIAATLMLWVHRIWPAYIISFVLMCAAFYLGCRIKKRRG